MKATTLLEQQHRAVAAVFELLKAGRSDASELLTRLADDLASHMAIEQNLFYPAVREVDVNLVDESFEEHAIVELALKRLLRTDPTDPSFEAKLMILEDLVEAHVDEEEQQLFPAVEQALGPERLEALGHQLDVAWRAAQSEGFAALVPQTFARTSADDAREALSGLAERPVLHGRGAHARRA